MKVPRIRMALVDTNFIDRSDVFVTVTSPRWRAPQQISIEQLISDIQSVKFPQPKKYDISQDIDNNTLVVDENTLKVKIAPSYQHTPDVFSERFIDQNISYSKPPQDASMLTGMHLMTDGNYLYIWIKNRWKRVPLSEW